MGQPVVHFEIGCRNKEQTEGFYSELFGWKVESFGAAGMISTGSEAGIGGHFTALGHEPHNYVLVYVLVDDIPACLARAEELGGKTLLPQTEVPGMGWFAWLADPEGTTVGIWKPMSQ